MKKLQKNKFEKLFQYWIGLADRLLKEYEGFN